MYRVFKINFEITGEMSLERGWVELLFSLKSCFSRGSHWQGFPGGSDGKESACSAGDMGLIPGSDPWVRKIPWRREWLPSPVSLPGESHGQRSLVGCSPWGRKESDTTDQLTLSSINKLLKGTMTNLRPSGQRLRRLFQNDTAQIGARVLTQAGWVREEASLFQ